MNTKETMQALLEGKKIALLFHRYMYINAEGRLVDPNGNARAIDAGVQYSLYIEPNPHTPGTFDWAREESLRGNLVRRVRHRLTGFVIGGIEAPRFDHAMFYASDLTATDWEIVERT